MKGARIIGYIGYIVVMLAIMMAGISNGDTCADDGSDGVVAPARNDLIVSAVNNVDADDDTSINVATNVTAASYGAVVVDNSTTTTTAATVDDIDSNITVDTTVGVIDATISKDAEDGNEWKKLFISKENPKIMLLPALVSKNRPRLLDADSNASVHNVDSSSELNDIMNNESGLDVGKTAGSLQYVKDVLVNVTLSGSQDGQNPIRMVSIRNTGGLPILDAGKTAGSSKDVKETPVHVNVAGDQDRKNPIRIVPVRNRGDPPVLHDHDKSGSNRGADTSIDPIVKYVNTTNPDDGRNNLNEIKENDMNQHTKNEDVEIAELYPKNTDSVKDKSLKIEKNQSVRQEKMMADDAKMNEKVQPSQTLIRKSLINIKKSGNRNLKVKSTRKLSSGRVRSPLAIHPNLPIAASEKKTDKPKPVTNLSKGKSDTKTTLQSSAESNQKRRIFSTHPKLRNTTTKHPKDNGAIRPAAAIHPKLRSRNLSKKIPVIDGSKPRNGSSILDHERKVKHPKLKGKSQSLVEKEINEDNSNNVGSVNLKSTDNQKVIQTKNNASETVVKQNVNSDDAKKLTGEEAKSNSTTEQKDMKQSNIISPPEALSIVELTKIKQHNNSLVIALSEPTITTEKSKTENKLSDINKLNAESKSSVKNTDVNNKINSTLNLGQSVEDESVENKQDLTHDMATNLSLSDNSTKSSNSTDFISDTNTGHPISVNKEDKKKDENKLDQVAQTTSMGNQTSKKTNNKHTQDIQIISNTNSETEEQKGDISISDSSNDEITKNKQTPANKIIKSDKSQDISSEESKEQVTRKEGDVSHTSSEEDSNEDSSSEEENSLASSSSTNQKINSDVKIEKQMSAEVEKKKKAIKKIVHKNQEKEPRKSASTLHQPEPAKSSNTVAVVSILLISLTLVVTVLGVYYKKISFSTKRYGQHIPLCTREDEVTLFSRITAHEAEHEPAYESWRQLN